MVRLQVEKETESIFEIRGSGLPARGPLFWRGNHLGGMTQHHPQIHQPRSVLRSSATRDNPRVLT